MKDKLPLKASKPPKELDSPIISEPENIFLSEERVNAPIPSDQKVIYQNEDARKHKYNPDSNAKIIEVKANGSVIYSY